MAKKVDHLKSFRDKTHAKPEEMTKKFTLPANQRLYERITKIMNSNLMPELFDEPNENEIEILKLLEMFRQLAKEESDVNILLKTIHWKRNTKRGNIIQEIFIRINQLYNPEEKP